MHVHLLFEPTSYIQLKCTLLHLLKISQHPLLEILPVGKVHNFIFTIPLP